MQDFLHSLANYSFLQRAVAAAVLCSVGFGLTGPFVVTKRLTFLAGGIAHAVMGGIGIAYFLNINTTAGAVAAAIFFAFILALFRGTTKNEDTLVSTLWASGMSVGILFMYLTPGYNADLSSFIFGNILMVRTVDIVIIAVLDGIVLVTVYIFYYHFVFISFDEDFLEVRGIRTRIIYFLLLVIISLTVVVTIQIVGLILVIALISLPSVIASLFIRNLKKMMAAAALLGIIVTTAGIYIAYQTNIPASASIILLASALYFISLGFRKIAE